MFWRIIIGLALMILGYLLMPRPKVQRPEITEMEGPTAEAGRPIPVVFGDKIVKDPNFLDWRDKSYIDRKYNSGGGKGKKK